MKYLAIDYGLKRTGIAVSDDTGTLAFPLKVLRNTARMFDEIAALVVSEGAGAVVLGESKNLDMKDNPVMSEIRKLKERLEKAGVRVEFHPEFYSSAQVVTMMGEHNKSIDASAAAIILQNYLDLHNR